MHWPWPCSVTFLVRSEGWRSSQPLMPSWGSTRSSKPRPTRGCHVIAQRYAVDPNAACSGFENGSGKVGRLRMVQRGSSGPGAPPSARSAPYVATSTKPAAFDNNFSSWSVYSRVGTTSVID